MEVSFLEACSVSNTTSMEDMPPSVLNIADCAGEAPLLQPNLNLMGGSTA